MRSPGLLFALGWLCFSLSLSSLLVVTLDQPLWGMRSLSFLPTTLTVLAAPVVARRIWHGNAGSAVRQLAGHGAAAALFGMSEVTFLIACGWLRTPPIAPNVWVLLLMRSGVAYGVVAAATLAGDAARRRREAARERAEAAAHLARASLDAACWRLQPDIVLPALRHIEGALDGDPDEAADRIARLGDLLRLLLRDAGAEASVAEEAALLAAAADVTLGPGALRVRVAPAASGSAMPRLLLLAIARPLLAAGRGTMSVAVERDGGRVHIEIDSDAGGLDRALAEGRLRARWPDGLEISSGARALHLSFPAEAPA